MPKLLNMRDDIKAYKNMVRTGEIVYVGRGNGRWDGAIRVLLKPIDGIAEGGYYVTGQYGNPYMIPADGNRDEVVEQFTKWFLHENNRSIIFHMRRTLMGRDLICFCAPQRCHGEIIMKYINGPHPQSDECGCSKCKPENYNVGMV